MEDGKTISSMWLCYPYMYDVEGGTRQGGLGAAVVGGKSPRSMEADTLWDNEE